MKFSRISTESRWSVGVKDQALQEYLKDSEHFADLINGTLFDGKRVIESGYLTEVQKKKRLLLRHQQNDDCDFQSENQNLRLEYMERERDVMMLHDKPDMRCLVDCEGQSDADYNMPVRNLCYDAIEYAEQIGTQRYKRKDQDGKVLPLIPIFNLVIYLGESRWKSKHTLFEMMQIPEELKEYIDLVPNYRIHVADIYEQDPENFHTEWKDIFQLMKHSRKKEELKEYIEKHRGEIRKLSIETRCLLGALLDQYDIMENDKMEAIDVCQAWDGAMLMYRDEGIAIGRSEGITIGRSEGFAQRNKCVAKNMYHRGYSVEDTAGIVEEDVATVEKWFEEFRAGG